MKKILLSTAFLGIFLLVTVRVTAQISISTDNSPADNSAMLDVKSTNKGVVLPRLTSAQISAIVNPVDGLLVYNVTNGKLYIYVSSAMVWKEVNYGTGTLLVSQTFYCGSSFVDSRDNKSYGTVQIGNQCWMGQNLNLGTKILGNANQTNNGIIEKYCYNDDENNCNIYGGLYQWDEAMQYVNTEGVPGICPTGWHLPTDAEWTTLTTYLGGEAVSGGKMKETGTMHWASPNAGATNESGFTALGSGHRNVITGFNSIGGTAGFWSSSQYTATNAWYRDIYYYYWNVTQLNGSKTFGFSVRCLKDN